MRVQVNVNDNLVKKIDEYASAMGVSRSALCSVWIATAIMGMEKGLDTISAMGNDLTQALLDKTE